MNWSFALINGKLAELFVEDEGKQVYLGHCYVKKSDYKTKSELGWIENDTAEYKLKYRGGKYVKLSP